jgi:Family of unknown function (DUF5996)
MAMDEREGWPPLPYDMWRETLDTLHMYTQVIGKLRLALSPFEPEWAHVPLYVTSRGLGTSTVPFGLRTFDAELDLLEHVLVMRSSEGIVEHRPLGGSVADFYADVMRALQRMEVDAHITVVPSEVPDPIPFPDDQTHHTYEPRHATRFFRVLSMVDVVLKEHRAHFRGRTPPVQFFWGSFDIVVNRYSGRSVPARPGAGVIERVGGDAEQICAGWWPGDERRPYPAFFAYAYPPHDGMASVPLEPAGAVWNEGAGEFLLPYDSVRSEVDPRSAIHAFFDSTYEGCSRLLDWDPGLTDVRPPGHTRPVTRSH